MALFFEVVEALVMKEEDEEALLPPDDYSLLALLVEVSLHHLPNPPSFD